MASRGLSGIQRSSRECHSAPVLAGELTRHHVSLVLQHVLPAPDRFSGRFV